jgi:hypothetical protein
MRPAIQPSGESSTPLAAEVEALRARPAILPATVMRPERMDAIDAELTAIAARRADLDQQRRIQLSGRIAAERDAERATAAAERMTGDLERLRGKSVEAVSFLRRLDQPDAELQTLIRQQAMPMVRRALEGEPMAALQTALHRLRNTASALRAESTERGMASFADVPAGRAVFLTGGIAEPAMSALEGLDRITLPVLVVAKSGDYVLSRLDRQTIAEIARAAAGPQETAGGDYDACLLRGLAGTSGDVAARAIIGACRSQHPRSARHDVVLRFDEIRRFDEAYLFTGAAVADLLEALRRFAAEAARLVDETAATIVADAREEAGRAREGFEREASALEQRLAGERAAAAGAQDRLAAARAAEDAATRSLAEFAATSGEVGLRAELAALDAAFQAETKAAATAAAEANARQAAELVQAGRRLDEAIEGARSAASLANARQAEELAAAQRALAAAVETRRQADAPRLRPLIERESEAQQRLSRATTAATAAAGPNVAARRAAYLAELGRNGVEGQFRASVRLDLQLSAKMCLAFSNQGRFAIAKPGFEILFRGRPVRELGIDPRQLILLFDDVAERGFVYRNQYNESVLGLRPGQTLEPNCKFIQRTDGDYGRIFERVGGSITSWRDASNWSVRVSGQLSLPEDVQEWREPYSSERRWRHVATPPERLFVGELAAAEAEARAQIERGAGTRGDVAAAAQPAPAAAPATPEPVPAATPDPARQEAALRLDANRIREIQRRLTALGHDTRGADGRIGPGTRASIAAFQRARGLPATGFIGAAELRALDLDFPR